MRPAGAPTTTRSCRKGISTSQASTSSGPPTPAPVGSMRISCGYPEPLGAAPRRPPTRLRLRHRRPHQRPDSRAGTVTSAVAILPALRFVGRTSSTSRRPTTHLRKTGGCGGCPDAGAVSEQRITVGRRRRLLRHVEYTRRSASSVWAPAIREPPRRRSSLPYGCRVGRRRCERQDSTRRRCRLRREMC